MARRICIAVSTVVVVIFSLLLTLTMTNIYTTTILTHGNLLAKQSRAINKNENTTTTLVQANNRNDRDIPMSEEWMDSNGNRTILTSFEDTSQHGDTDTQEPKSSSIQFERSIDNIETENETNGDTINTKTTIKSPIYYNITKDMDTYKPPNTPGAFIHIGKTGGSTISLLLRNGCHSFAHKPCQDLSERQPESYVSYLSTYYHIPDFTNGKLLQHSQTVGYDFYVINIRDPMDRTISAYYASHPDHFMVSKYTEYKSKHPESGMTFETYRINKRRTMNTNYKLLHIKSTHFKMYESYTCFPTLQDFAMLIGHNHDEYTLTEEELETHTTDYAVAAAAARDPTDNNRTCSNLARAVIHNQLDLTHMFWNYQTVMSLIDGWQDSIKEKNKRQDEGRRRRLTRSNQRNGNREENQKGKYKNVKSEQPKKAGTILVLRNEFKWNDWTSVNEWLGQEHGTVATYPSLAMRNRTKDNEFGIPISRKLSEEARSYMCNAIVEEYRIYFNLLEMAANLNEMDVRMSHNRSRESCPNLFDEHGSFLYNKRRQ